MTRKEVIAAIRATGCSAKFVPTGEWRVVPPGGNEDSAYYTTDADDAIATARDMGKRHDDAIVAEISTWGADFNGGKVVH